MEDVTQQLNSWKRNLESAKKDQALSEGRISEMMKRLKDDYGVDNIGDAETLLAQLKIEIQDLETGIREDFTKLQQDIAEAQNGT